MSKKRPDIWMPIYIGDYLADTQHLSAEQSGAYLHLLMHSWKVGPLPGDTEVLRRIARIDKDAWSIAWAVLTEFFKQTEDGNFVQSRLEIERAAWGAKKASSVARARDAANKRWKGECGGNAPSIPPSNARAMLERCPSPPPPSLKTKAIASAFVLPEWIDKEAWAGYEEMRNKLRKPMTLRAKSMVVKELDKLRAAGHDANACLNQSTMKTWTDVYPLRGTALFSGIGSTPDPKTQFVDPSAIYDGPEYQSRRGAA